MKSKYHYDNNFTIQPVYYNDLLLYQLGEMMCDVDTVVDSHLHLNWYEFTYVFAGKGLAYTNNQPQKIVQNDIYFSMPNEVHKIVSDNITPLRYFFCAFNLSDDSPLKPCLDEIAEIIKGNPKRCFNNAELSVHFKHFLSFIKSEKNIYKKILEYEFKTVILKALSILKAEKSDDYRVPKINNVQLLCFNIINYIDNNVMKMENVSCLSDVLGYNYSYLSRCFKNTIGESISDYFYNKKLTLAKIMIEQGEHTITQIASTLNYSSIYVFSRAFKQKYKISPNNYKLSLANKLL